MWTRNSMRLLFVNPIGHVGGAEKVLLALLRELSTRHDYQLHLIMLSDGPLVNIAQELGVTVNVLPLPERLNQAGDSSGRGSSLAWRVSKVISLAIAIPAFIQYLWAFNLAIAQIAPDLIHSNGVKTHVLLAASQIIRLLGVKQTTRIPVVWHLHEFYGSRPVVAKLLRWASSQATLGIAISQAVAADARTALPDLSTQVIYNAVDLDEFHPAFGDRLSAEPEKTIRIGLVATFAYWKGHQLFLEAAAQVLRDRPNLPLKFVIVGGPIYLTQGSQVTQAHLEQQAIALGIQEWVEFWGFQAQMAAVYHRLDIIVHASTQPEPFGLVIIEAMACGKPVIVAQAGGAAELFTSGVDALGFVMGDRQSLVDAMISLLDSPQQQETLAQNARNTVVKRFSLQDFSQTVITVYTELCQETSAR
jgi:glycosyltransferase involved in cell wall biosynthesis